jgi:hypothetical protein
VQGLSIAELRARVPEPRLMMDDHALVALLSRLPECTVSGGSLFETVLLPPGRTDQAASPAPLTSRDRSANRPARPRRQVAESLPLF